MAARMTKTKVPGIYRRGSRYVVVWLHRGRQHRQSFRTFAEAREAKGQRDGGDRKAPARERFEDDASAWIDSYKGRTRAGLSDGSRDDYKHSLDRHVIPFFRGYKLGEIEAPDIKAFITKLERSGVSRATIKRRLAPLSALCATAVEDGRLRFNPVTGVRLAPNGAEPVEKRALTRDELGAFLAALPDEWRLFFELLAHTGVRVSEAVGLTWANVDFGKRRLKIRSQIYRGVRKPPKSRYGVRDIPLSARMAQRLWNARQASDYRADADPVFASATGTPLLPHNIFQRVVKPTREAVGLEWVSAHSFRHSCASFLFEAGRNPKQIQEWLGHHSAAFTLSTYVHLIDGGLGDADFFDQAVQVGQGDNGVTTRHPQTAANADPGETKEIAI
jgi:integrase